MPAAVSSRTKFAEPERIDELAEVMGRNSYLESDFRAILGGNFRRVFQQIWK